MLQWRGTTALWWSGHTDCITVSKGHADCIKVPQGVPPAGACYARKQRTGVYSEKHALPGELSALVWRGFHLGAPVGHVLVVDLRQACEVSTWLIKLDRLLLHWGLSACRSLPCSGRMSPASVHIQHVGPLPVLSKPLIHAVGHRRPRKQLLLVLPPLAPPLCVLRLGLPQRAARRCGAHDSRGPCFVRRWRPCGGSARARAGPATG